MDQLSDYRLLKDPQLCNQPKHQSVQRRSASQQKKLIPYPRHNKTFRALIYSNGFLIWGSSECKLRSVVNSTDGCRCKPSSYEIWRTNNFSTPRQKQSITGVKKNRLCQCSRSGNRSFCSGPTSHARYSSEWEIQFPIFIHVLTNVRRVSSVALGLEFWILALTNWSEHKITLFTIGFLKTNCMPAEIRKLLFYYDSLTNAYFSQESYITNSCDVAQWSLYEWNCC